MPKKIKVASKVLAKKAEAASEEKSNAEEKEASPKVAANVLKKSEKTRPCECCPAGPNPVAQPGQKYFEAPDGHLILGEADKQQLWDRRLNNGKGAWINPAR